MSLARYIGTNNVDWWVNKKVTKLTTCETCEKQKFYEIHVKHGR